MARRPPGKSKAKSGAARRGSTSGGDARTEAAGPDFHFKHVFTQENAGKLDDDYALSKDMLGEGSYGQVCKGVHKLTGAERAIKMIAIEKISDRERFEEEMSVQQSLDHPHIVKLYEIFEDAKKVYMVLELCTGGELFDRIVDESEKAGEGKAFGEQMAVSFMQQILGAIRYLHSKRYVHRDIKPENFLLQNESKDAPIKVIDFGLAKKFTPGKSELHTKAGTPYYVAPEVLLSNRRQGYNEKCDIWSCGVLCYIIRCGYPPFYGDTDDQILRMVKKGKFSFPERDWQSVSADAKDFIRCMLTLDPTERASAEDLLNHPWLTKASAVKTSSSGPLASNFCANLRAFRTAGKLKKICLTLIAKHLKESEIIELQRTFQLLDANQDGSLTVNEIRDGMAKHGLAIPQDLENVVKNLDTDGSGSIDYTEFIAATITQKHYSDEAILWSAFRIFDRDNSGEITTAELKYVLRDLNDKDLSLIFKEGDVDNNGTISFDEFKNMMTEKANASLLPTNPAPKAPAAPPPAKSGRKMAR